MKPELPSCRTLQVTPSFPVKPAHQILSDENCNVIYNKVIIWMSANVIIFDKNYCIILSCNSCTNCFCPIRHMHCGLNYTKDEVLSQLWVSLIFYPSVIFYNSWYEVGNRWKKVVFAFRLAEWIVVRLWISDTNIHQYFLGMCTSQSLKKEVMGLISGYGTSFPLFLFWHKTQLGLGKVEA